MNTTITNNTNIGTMTNPFLSRFEQWTIESRPINKEEEVKLLAEDTREPTLMWVGDGKVHRLFIPHCSADDFWQTTGLRPSMEKGGYTLSKRLKRILSPQKYGTFMRKQCTEDNCRDSGGPAVSIHHDESLNPALWDGCGQVSVAFVEKFVQELNLSEREERDLLNTHRFEVTLMHDQGQEKGHVIVMDGLETDFRFPANSFKRQLRLEGVEVYVALTPIHKHDSMLLDIQSLINLHPFFTNAQLLAWHRDWLHAFAVGIREGRQTATMMKRLAHIESEEELDKAKEWHVMDYLSSGGHPMWFAGIVKALGNQVIKMLGNKLNKCRFPIPGGRYYIMPAAVGNRAVPTGHIELDAQFATAWVNDEDWLHTIVDILGGCDGDDALWVYPFTDKVDGEKKVLAWRSPNQLGEYVLHKPTERCQPLLWETADGDQLSWVEGDSSKLPPRIDAIQVNYGTLIAEAGCSHLSYSIEAMWPSVVQGQINANVLGGFCNLLMVAKSVYGRLPKRMPASMEDVIDAMVKEGRDLAPVKAWLNQSALAMATQQTAVPKVLMPRLMPLLGSNQQARSKIRLAENHWLDSLVNTAEMQLDAFEAEIQALSYQACPPIGLFHAYRDWIEAGKLVKTAYALALRNAPKACQGELDEVAYTIAAKATEIMLDRYDESQRWKVLIGTALYCYSVGFNKEKQACAGDQVLWQLGIREDESAVRGHGIAQHFIDALRQTGLLTTPVWMDGGVYHEVQDVPLKHRGALIRFNGVWFNFLNRCLESQGMEPYERMGQVAIHERLKMKQKIQKMAERTFGDMRLNLVNEKHNEDQRLVAYTELGNKFGLVDPWYPVEPGPYMMAWAIAEDGNIYGLLNTDS